MKIFGGTFKGKNIIVPKSVRPVSLRVKKSCFDILREEFKERAILDLFAGSGSLGLEALSHGSSNVVFVDADKASVKIINRNIIDLGLTDRSRVNLKDAVAAIGDFAVYREKFDIIFLDPPYYQGTVTKALQALREYDILTPSGYIVAFCYRDDDFLDSGEQFSLIVKRRYGQTFLLIYAKHEKSYLSGDI